MFVMPDKINGAHPFVASSRLNPLRDDEELEFEEQEARGADGPSGENHTSMELEVQCQNPAGDSSAGNNGGATSSAEDRRATFVINDNASMGQSVFMASKPLRTSGDVGQRRVTALALREHGTSKFSKVLRFMYAVPNSIGKELTNWIAVPKPNITLHDTLFSGYDDVAAKIVEAVLSQVCVPLTMGQRCADWFVLRQFRVTGTNAGLILNESLDYRLAVHLPISNSIPVRSTDEWFSSFHGSWFSDKVSTEAMMRGSANEVA